MLMTVASLRECVRAILLEKAEAPASEEIFLSSDEILLALEHNPDTATLHGVEVYTPYRVRKQMPSRPRGGALAALNPFDVISTMKYDSIHVRGGKSLKAEPHAATEAIDTMAGRIARRFEDADIKLVTCVDSSHDMAAALASSVAEKLGKPYQPIVRKTMDPNVTWDPDMWEAYASKVRSTGLNGKGGAIDAQG